MALLRCFLTVYAAGTAIGGDHRTLFRRQEHKGFAVVSPDGAAIEVEGSSSAGRLWKDEKLEVASRYHKTVDLGLTALSAELIKEVFETARSTPVLLQQGAMRMFPKLGKVEYEEFVNSCAGIPNESLEDVRRGLENLKAAHYAAYSGVMVGCFAAGALGADDCLHSLEPQDLRSFTRLQLGVGHKTMVQHLFGSVAATAEHFGFAEAQYLRNPNFKSHHAPGCEFLNEAIESGLTELNLTMFPGGYTGPWPIMLQGGLKDGELGSPYIMHKHPDWSSISHAEHFQGFATLVLQGHKRWAIYPNSEREKLYQLEHPSSNLEEFEFNPFDPDYSRHPRARDAQGWMIDVKPGDVLLLPPEEIHMVLNVENSMGIGLQPLFRSKVAASG